MGTEMDLNIIAEELAWGSTNRTQPAREALARIVTELEQRDRLMQDLDSWAKELRLSPLGQFIGQELDNRIAAAKSKELMRQDPRGAV